MAAVGFDMYCDLIRRAVAELRDKPVEDLSVARLDIDVDAYIPADYISFEAARIDVHHRIAAARDEQELEELLKELRDRFGEPPEMVYNLMSMQEIRLRAAVLGAATVTYRRNRLELGDIRLDSGQRTALEKSGLKFAFHPLKRTLTIWPGEEEGLSVVKRMLDAIIDSLLTPVAKL
ncbi:MAG: TRCF domain-containing protein [Thermoleophilia bacterium]